MEETIENFFNNRTIFITGGTGFMGKVLIEKLARSCPGIKKIYMLIRPSVSGKSGRDRIADLVNIEVFNRIKEERPGHLEKVLYPVEGDVQKLGLGISEDDYKLLIKEVSVIFHAAASVRFDDPINDAIIMNTRGTREVVELAKKMKNLAVLVHVSTTFCNCYLKTVEEKIYPAPVDWREAIYLAETVDKETMVILQEKYLDEFPNTYVFTKNLAEKLLEDECRDIPTVIYRPSIVISAYEEPMPGWIDTFHGPVGLLIGIGKGVIRVAFSNATTRPDYMPVDLSIKGMIVAAWKKAVKDKENKEIAIYNSASTYKSIDIRELVQIGMTFTQKYPFLDSLWIPQITLTDNHTCFYVNTIIKQFLPAVAIDVLAKLLGKKLRVSSVVKLQRKIYQASMALSYFTSQNWYFINTNFLDLLKHIPDSDRQVFDFSFQDLNPEVYLNRAIKGGHQYLLHTNMTSIPAAIRRYKRLKFIDTTLKAIFLFVIFWYFWLYVISYIGSVM